MYHKTTKFYFKNWHAITNNEPHQRMDVNQIVKMGKIDNIQNDAVIQSTTNLILLLSYQTYWRKN